MADTPPKTYGREVTVGVTVWLLCVATYVIYTGEEPTKVSVLGMFVVPVLTLLGGIFGLKIYQQGTKSDDESTGDK